MNLSNVIAKAKQVETTTTTDEITMDTLFSAKVKRTLTHIGFHNFEITGIINNLPTSLIFEGQLVDDDKNVLDNTIYTMALRPFGDCTVFKTMVQDIIDQSEKKVDLSNIADLIGSIICVHVGENAKGYAVYHYNQQWLVNQYIVEQNASTHTEL